MKEYVSYMNECLFHQALATMWKFINATNSYFHSQEPWKVAQSNPQLFEEIIAATCQSLHTIGELLAPIMPQKMSDLLASINDPSHAREGVFVLKKIPPLFEKPITMNTEVTQGDSSEKKELSSCITIDDLSKVELRVGTIEACSNVEGSDKLVAMTVDLGDQGKRTVLAGLKKYYTPDQLVGKRGLYVTNLKPRKMAGIESHGMMLIGEGDNGKPQLISAHDSVPNGARLR
jgi:methionyl-tRNA synthetase